MIDTSGLVLVIVPAWNEERSIGRVVTELSQLGFTTLVVNDGSTDNTAHVARTAGARVISLPFNLGVGAALRCGFRYAVDNGFSIVVQCDADGQHPSQSISSMLNFLESQNAHMVIGSRFLDDAGNMRLSAIRRFAMRILSRSATRATGTSITDATSGFRAIREPLLSVLSINLPPYYLGDTYEALVSAGRAGYIIREMPAQLTERTHGKSSAHPLKAARLTVKAILSAILHLHQRLDGPTQRK